VCPTVMVVWLDGALAVLAYASTIIATLRAGSRGLYLMEHDQIGVMDGQLILGPTGRNETESSLLWELSFAFQESVRLSVAPHLFAYELVDDTLRDPNPPYSFDLEHIQMALYNDTQELDDYIEGIIAEEKGLESWHRLFKFPPLPSFLSIQRIQHVAVFGLLSAAKYVASWKAALWRSPEQDEDWHDIGTGEEDWDYRSRLVANIDCNGMESDEPPRCAKITAFAPQTFQDLRARFGVSETDFIKSILCSGPFVSFQSNSKGAARSGGVFFFTRDGSYMIKTIKRGEVGAFLDMLPKYHKYMRRNGRKSLLTRFFGMYSVSMDADTPKPTGIINSFKEKLMPSKTDEEVFVVMNSVFPAEGSKFISERYDLKGSTVGRECSEEEKLQKGSNAILKDLDLAREVELVRSLESPRYQSSYGINIGATAKSALLSQLRRDVKLLVECNVMDYSLLVGVVNMNSRKLDASSLEAFEKSEAYESQMLRRLKKKTSFCTVFFATIATPFRILGAPAIYFGRRLWEKTDTMISSIVTRPLPYYGAGICGIDGGALSLIKGKRNGKRAMYYIGIIDFLQPWTTKKVVERQFKGLMGYDTRAISCVPPDEYATRFLAFIDSHVI